jgi:predicted nucleic acid-binding protein
VVDASLLISLGKAGRLGLLLDATELELFVTPTVRAQLQSNDTRGPVEERIVAGRIQVLHLSSDDEAELNALAEWSELVDEGEAECIAVAVTRGWLVGLEDRAAQRAIRRRGGGPRWVGCADLLVLAVRARRLTVEEADAVLRSLDVYPGYEKRGIVSVRDLLRGAGS